MSIQLLSPQLANQIAAGEVVERPASVVKELLENSIDAGATRVEIDILAGGHKKILIRDNGKGIEKDELELALSRHATSKIKSLNDLEAITSMGFRGEALASISSVSRLTLTSKPAEQNEAWEAHSEGREMKVTLLPAAHPQGTSINVQDLFFNTPARRRFLRTEKTEFGHIETVFTRIAIANLSIEFVLTHNGKRVKHLKAVDSLQPRLTSLLGHLKKRTLWELNQNCEELSLKGLIVAPDPDQSHNDVQLSYVNGRPMRDKLINHAIRQAFEQIGVEDIQPQFVLFVTVDPNDVDVNVHPAKHEVRFHQSRLVHDFITSSFRQLLNEKLTLLDNKWESQIKESAPSHSYIAPLHSNENRERGIPSVTRPPHSNHVNRSAANHYEQLISATDSTAAGIELLTLDSQFALIRTSEDAEIYCVDWLKLTRLRLEQEISEASVSQPLLIPVAIPVPRSWSESTRQTLEKLHFQVDKVASKLILKQVPAGWRAMPWSLVFADLIEIQEDAKTHIVNKLCEHGLRENPVQIGSTKQWFLRQPERTQRDYLIQHAQKIAIRDIIALAGADKCQ